MVAPAATRLSFLAYPRLPRSLARATALEALARPLGLQVTVRLVSEAAELDGAFAASGADHDDPALIQSAGRAAAHVEIAVVGPDDSELPRGEVGEVVVRGDNVMLGYWNKPEETAAALRGGWMHTGDAGYLDDRGYLFIVDRLKDMIITGGENVYSAEVENALAKHPAVAACAVIGIPDARWGERVHAVVVRQPGQHATDQELQEFCREHLAGYKLPRSVAFADALPMSGAGKILKRELRSKYWNATDRNVS